MSIQWKWMIRLSVFLLFSGVFGLLHSETTYAASKDASVREMGNRFAQTAYIIGQITDHDGFPVKDVNVHIAQQTGGEQKQIVKTDSKGDFRFETAIGESTDFSIKAVAKGYLDSGMNFSYVTLNPGDTKVVNLVLFEPATIVGTVTDQSGKPIVGAIVKATTVSQTIKTDKNGNYAITGINAYQTTNIDVEVNANDYVPYTKYVTVSYGTTNKLNFYLQDAAAVNGVVINESGKGIIGAKVTINGLQTTTDKQGKYTMKQQLPGSSTISVEADGYIKQTIRVTLVKGPKNTFDFILKSNVDKTPPVTKYALIPLTEVSNGKQYINGFNFKLKATDEVDGSGLKMTQYRINGGQWITFTGPIKIYAPEVKTVEYFSTDVAGNQEKINKMDFVNGKYEGAGSYPY
ncbi:MULTISPECIES: carboxypeptidase-like regulatory domain-containing protein [Paenibacillus]|uniref:Carboxypeptidase family protein n=1 Tax=Paenibacillus pabuli TaxID=1472 RepID=A0A855XVW1_9BACL|nr:MULTISPECIES: carboxypeptidase-like regulatory domain-containing protein [Paenibacillus]PWW39751.1 carboxypeptidase family protein [Paenibacillus pabuli]PXW06783.1 carboxypeptidase family protein [Paenibacillus taichungensis]